MSYRCLVNESGSTPREATPAPRVYPSDRFVELPEHVDPADMTESVPHSQPQPPDEDNAALKYPG